MTGLNKRIELNQKNPLVWREIKALEEEEWLKGETCLNDLEYLEIVHDILKNKNFQSMKEYIQHGSTTTLTHSLHVSYYSYRMCKHFGWDYVAAARGGLLHDFFLYDWHTHCKETGEHFHGFYHPKRALKNAQKEFHLSDVEKDIIVKHMWPLTIIPPKTIEGMVVMYADKVCGFKETMVRAQRPQPIPTKIL